MPTHWKRASDNELRAHLQEAIAERLAADVEEDWSYSGYELAAIREELRTRRSLRAACRSGAEHAIARLGTFRVAV